MLVATTLAAQQAPAGFVTPEEDPVDTSWRLRRVASLKVGGQYALGAGLGLAYGRGPIPGPVARGARLSLMGHYGITGSRDAALTLEAPGVHRDWRAYATLRSERMLRTPYFGAFNEARTEDSLQERHGNRYYRYALLRSTAFGTLQRRMAGSLWLNAGGQVRRWRSSSLEGTPSLYQDDAGAADTQVFHGRELRAGALWDSRNDWVTPTRGLLVELLAASGRVSGGGVRRGYQRYLLSAREYLALQREGRTVLALRQRAVIASDTLPFFLAFEQPATWAPDDGIFSRRTVRLHGRGDQLASSFGMVSADVRHVLIPPDWLVRPRRLWITGFVDIATLWEPGDELLRRNAWTIGGGFRLQIGRSFLAGVDAGLTTTGPHASVGSQFGF